MKKLMLKILSAVALALIASSCVVDLNDGEMNEENYIGYESIIPDFTATDNPTEQALISPDYFTGKITMVVLFNSGCPDCKREIAKVVEAWSELKTNENYQVVGFARDQTWEEVEDYADVDWSYSEILYYGDKDRKIFNLFANMRIPRLYIVDENGSVRKTYTEHWLEDGVEVTADDLVRTMRAMNFLARM